MSAWIGRDEAANRTQIDCVVDQAVAGNANLVVIGSEALLRNDVTPDVLVNYILGVKARLAAAGISIPVTRHHLFKTREVFECRLN